MHVFGNSRYKYFAICMPDAGASPPRPMATYIFAPDQQLARLVYDKYLAGEVAFDERAYFAADALALTR